MAEIYLQGNETHFPFGMWTKKWAEKRPDKVAVADLDREQKCTYSDLHIRSNILANALLAKGLKKGDRIAITSENCIPYLELYFACAKLGIILFPACHPLSGNINLSCAWLLSERNSGANSGLGFNFTEGYVYTLGLPCSDMASPYQGYELLFEAKVLNLTGWKTYK